MIEMAPLYDEYFDASRREIPVSLPTDTFRAVGPDHAIWVSNVRGYSTGVALDLTILISPKLSVALGVPYPVLANDVPEDNNASTVDVTAETSGQTYSAATGTLVGLGARAGGRLAVATYWVPGHPNSLTLRVAWPNAEIEESITLTTDGWGQAVRAISNLW